MRISDWSSDVCSSDLRAVFIFDEAITLVAVEEFYGADGHGVFPFTRNGNPPAKAPAELVACEGKSLPQRGRQIPSQATLARPIWAIVAEKSRSRTNRREIARDDATRFGEAWRAQRSEEPTSELQSLMRNSYA